MSTEAKKSSILEFAKDPSGKVVNISEVANGNACNCTCLYCGEPLTAKQGNGGKAPHFAHKPDSKCQWKEYEKQTFIHWRAEKLFLEEKAITLPPINRIYGNIICQMFSGKESLPITPVELEQKISDFIPDIVLHTEDGVLLVEIYVTHAVDEAKKEKIRQDGRFDVIEIDLSDKAYDDITDEELRALLKDQTRMHWIYSRQEALFTSNLASVSSFYPIMGGTNTVAGCPQGILSHSQRNISHCDRCPLFLGKTSDNKACCFCNTWFAIKKGQRLPPLPPIWNAKKEYDKIVGLYKIVWDLYL